MSTNPLKKTMVYLGLADEEDQHYSEASNETQQRASNDRQNATPAPVVPLRKPTAVHHSSPAELNEILTVHPKQYSDARAIAETFRDGIPVIINLSQMSEGDARRLIDFSSGLSQGLGGKIERVTGKVFLLSPAHIAVVSDEQSTQAEHSSTFFAQQ